MERDTRTQKTIDHETIRRWVHERGGVPARTVKTGSENPKIDPGLLRIDFPGYGDEEDLEEIAWATFFSKFDEEQLAFIYQDETTEGESSRFCKLIKR